MINEVREATLWAPTPRHIHRSCYARSKAVTIIWTNKLLGLEALKIRRVMMEWVRRDDGDNNDDDDADEPQNVTGIDFYGVTRS